MNIGPVHKYQVKRSRSNCKKTETCHFVHLLIVIKYYFLRLRHTQPSAIKSREVTNRAYVCQEHNYDGSNNNGESPSTLK